MFCYHKSERSEEKEEFHIKSLCAILSKYRWLTDSYNVDFFLNSHWDRLPKCWSPIVDKFDLKDVESLLTNNSQFSLKSSVLPLSLLSLRATSLAFQLSRKLTNDSEIILSKYNLKFPQISQLFQNGKNCDKIDKTSKVKNEIFNRHIKQKKRHEIVQLSQIIDQIMHLIPNCDTIVDCGSGQGHLSRILSLYYGYNVISIEADSNNVSGAVKLDNNILNSLSRYNLTEKTHSNCPQKVNYLLNKTSSVNDVTSNSKNHALVGLHACGPLSHIILKQFANCNEAKALVLVSCCYMKIDGNSFPLSQLTKNIMTDPLSYEAKEVGCHAIEKFVQKLKTEGNLESLNVHCFRSILESLIDRYHPNMRHKAMRSVRIEANMTFKEYFHKAVRGFDIVIPEEELESEYVNKCLTQMKRVVIFYSLKLLIAPLIESLILLDFISYLRENGIPTALFPLFDPILSPRNNVLIAIKEEMNKMNL